MELQYGRIMELYAPITVARFRFFGPFWDRATSCTPVVAEKCRKTWFGGMKWPENPCFVRKYVARFEI